MKVLRILKTKDKETICSISLDKKQKKECFSILNMINDIVQMIISGLKTDQICDSYSKTFVTIIYLNS